MLHRLDDEGIIAITQPAHAWISGQLARHWGNRQFAPACEEACLAAEQHDIGFLRWEQSPTLDQAIGLPHSFLDLPRRTHLALWTEGIRQMMRFGRYPALLVSLHFTRLAKFDLPSARAKIPEATRAFIEAQVILQTALKTSLENDFHYAPVSTDEVIERNRRLLSLWDWMSLQLCFGMRAPESLSRISDGDNPANINLARADMTGTRIRVSPWPFREDEVQLVCEGRRLLRRYASEREMRAKLRASAPVTIPIHLVRD